MRDSERIAALEQELAALKDKISPRPRPPASIADDAVRVTNVQMYKCEMPTAAEYEGLLSVVQRLHPRIVPTFEVNRLGTHANDRRKYLDRFTACFQRIESLWRFDGEALGPKRVDYWVDEALRWLGPRGMPDIDQSHYVAAALSWGDINCSISRAPYDVFIGVTYSGAGARPASSASWKRVLETGTTRPPVSSGSQVIYPPSPVRITVG